MATAAEIEKKKRDRREYMRLYWYKRYHGSGKKAVAYRRYKKERKAAWQKSKEGAQANRDCVARFRERWGRWPAKSARAKRSSIAEKKEKSIATALKTSGSRKVAKKMTEKRSAAKKVFAKKAVSKNAVAKKSAKR